MPKVKVLIVEDDRSLAEVVSYNLTQAGYDVLMAHDGQDGMNQAKDIAFATPSVKAPPEWATLLNLETPRGIAINAFIVLFFIHYYYFFDKCQPRLLL